MADNVLDRIKNDQSEQDKVFSYLQDNNLIETIIKYAIDYRDVRKTVWLKPWLEAQVKDATPELIQASKDAVKGLQTYDWDKKAIACLRYVKSNVRYVTDDSKWKVPEVWQEAYTTLGLKTGDCFAGYEQIYTEDGIKRIDEIKPGDRVLSYDFEEKEYVTKEVIAHWPKGALPIARVHLRNGQYFDVTEDHPMWCRINQKGPSVYEKRPLSEIDLSRWWKRKIPYAKKLPYAKSSPKFEKDLYRVLGHYLAEGTFDGQSKVESSGYELIEEIIPLLEKHEVPFSEYTNNSGVPCIRFLKSDFKDYLKLQKTNSFDIHLLDEIVTLPEDYLEELLYGMWLGDGTKNQYADKRGFSNNKEWTYSTSSKQLADDLQRIHLQLGKPLHIWKQENHQGAGTNPIYRINYNPESHFSKDFGCGGLSEVSISRIEMREATEMFDLTVQDTHTVILKNGSILHQCEDGAILMYVLARLAGIPSNRLLLFAGSVNGGGHCWLGYRPVSDPLNFRFLDWCYWPDISLVESRKFYSIIGKQIYSFQTGAYKKDNNYYNIWWAFNEDATYFGFKKTV